MFFKSFLYSLHSVQMGFPLYFGLPSVIFKVPGFILQILQTTIDIRQNVQFIKIGIFSKMGKFRDMVIQVILWDCLEIKTGEKFAPKSNKNIFKKMPTI